MACGRQHKWPVDRENGSSSLILDISRLLCEKKNAFAPEVQGYDRLGETHYAGDACVYLASDMSFFISGQIINGDGAGHFGRF